MFRTQQGFDRRLFRPAALGYKHAIPTPVRSGIRNVFSNLGEPIVFLNYLLQLKPGKAAETLGRFMINSTLGLAGTIDIAKSPGVRLPHRSNGFGNTLGFYGVKPGPYIFLPFVGPSTLRDLLGGQADALVLPLAVGSPFDRLEYQAPKAVITGLDMRAEADDDLRALFDGAVDPYATLRSVYLQNRAAEIQQLKGKPAKAGTGLDDPLADPAGGTMSELSDPLTDPAPTPDSPTAELNDPLTDPAAKP
jgi:phospholipid-binding lipoprotein MlaA